MINLHERINAIRQLEPVAPAERKKLNIEDLQIGGFIKVEGNAFQVKSLGYYLDVKWKNFSVRKSEYWVTELELFNLHNGEIKYFEWERDDELELSITEELVKLRDIKYSGRSLTQAHLDSIADNEEGTVLFKGVNYHYVEDDTWAGRYSKDKRKDGAPMRAYEFEGDNGTSLTIEAWHEDDDERPDREAFLSRSVSVRDIEILQLNKQ